MVAVFVCKSQKRKKKRREDTKGPDLFGFFFFFFVVWLFWFCFFSIFKYTLLHILQQYFAFSPPKNCVPPY